MARGEITGKKTTTANGPKYKRKAPNPDPNALALSIKTFCILHNVSEDLFYKMQREGWAPRTMAVGSRTLISHEAAAEWRRAREQAAKEAAEKEAAATAA